MDTSSRSCFVKNITTLIAVTVITKKPNLSQTFPMGSILALLLPSWWITLQVNHILRWLEYEPDWSASVMVLFLVSLCLRRLNTPEQSCVTARLAELPVGANGGREERGQLVANLIWFSLLKHLCNAFPASNKHQMKLPLRLQSLVIEDRVGNLCLKHILSYLLESSSNSINKHQ